MVVEMHTDARQPAAGLNVHVMWRRFGALIVDSIVMTIVYGLLGSVYGVTQITSGSPFPAPGGGFTAYSAATQLILPERYIVLIAYYVVQESLFGATVGKFVAHLRVVDLQGRRPSWQAVLIRNLVRPIDALPFASGSPGGQYGLGAIATWLSPYRQRLGDRAASTLVVDAATTAYSALPAFELRRRAVTLAFGIYLLIAISVTFAYFGRPPLQIESWRNTGAYVFNQPVTSYDLGPARWGPGMVTYTLRYQLARDGTRCHGIITLRWAGILQGGWQEGPATMLCGKNTYGYAGA